MMSCFPCFSSQKSKKAIDKNEHSSSSSHRTPSRSPAFATDIKKQKPTDEDNKDRIEENGKIDAQIFTFRELATATKNFRQECLLGEGGFGRVFKATLQPSGQVVAVKQLDRNGLQGNKEFLGEVKELSLLNHPNLVKFNGYCADGDQRLLVYEFMSGGSLEDCLLDMKKDRKPLNWFIRIKIASGVAKGLEYLHDKADPPIIYRDLKSSNILLDEDFNPKLSDFGLVKLSPAGDKSPLPSRVMGTYGYSAPEYTRSGQLTLKSDIYSFGVVMLELITGRRAIDTTKPNSEQNLVTWAQPLFRDPKRFPDMADPLLERRFPEKDLNQAVAIAAMCLQEEAEVRPLIGDVVTALSFLSTTPDENLLPLPLPTPPEEKLAEEKEDDRDQADEDSSDSSDSEARKITKDRDSSEDKDGASSAKFRSARNGHESDTSDDEDQKHQNKKKNEGKETEHKRVVFKDDLHPNLSRKSSSSSSSDESSSSSPRSSNASEDGRIVISQQSSREWGDLSAASSNGSSRKSHESDGVPFSQEHIEASEDVNIVSLDHNSSRGSHSGDDGSVHSDHSDNDERFEAGNYSSDSEG